MILSLYNCRSNHNGKLDFFPPPIYALFCKKFSWQTFAHLFHTLLSGLGTSIHRLGSWELHSSQLLASLFPKLNPKCYLGNLRRGPKYFSIWWGSQPLPQTYYYHYILSVPIQSLLGAVVQIMMIMAPPWVWSRGVSARRWWAELTPCFLLGAGSPRTYQLIHTYPPTVQRISPMTIT